MLLSRSLILSKEERAQEIADMLLDGKSVIGRRSFIGLCMVCRKKFEYQERGHSSYCCSDACRRNHLYLTRAQEVRYHHRETTDPEQTLFYLQVVDKVRNFVRSQPEPMHEFEKRHGYPYHGLSNLLLPSIDFIPQNLQSLLEIAKRFGVDV